MAPDRDQAGGSRLKILVIKHGAFGDIIQTDGALRDIRAHHSGAEIVALTTSAYRHLLERSPSIDRVIVDRRPPRWRLDLMATLRGTLRAERFQRVYDLQNSIRTASYRQWMLPDVPWSGKARKRTFRLRAEPQTLPSLQRMAAQLREAGVAVHHAERPDVSWMADDVSDVLADAGVRQPFVVLIPGSSARHIEKRWPYYPALAEELLANGIGVVTAPGPDESDRAKSVPGAVLTGPKEYLNWFELAGLFARAAFVVGNDTGPSHLASHIGAQGLALFGSHTPPAMTGIVRENFDAIAVPDLADLAVERVLAVVLDRLGHGSNPKT